jgi:hypothetical protein
MDCLKTHRLRLLACMSGVMIICAAIPPAFANNYGEDNGWQFETPTDQANMAVVQDMIQKKKGGGYGASNYNTYNTTTIDHQTNCTVSSTVYGNYGTNMQTGNDPSTSGGQVSSTGNSNGSTVSQEGGDGLPVNVTNGQGNSGHVNSSYSGNSTSVNASGPVNQALNSTQTNSGTQTASVTGSTACSGALN